MVVAWMLGTVMATDWDQKWLVINLEEQKIRAYENRELKMEVHCSPGANGATPRGKDFWISRKVWESRALPKYGGGKLPYSMRIKIISEWGYEVPIAIHGSNHVPNYPASHGCVRVRVSDARKLYDWTPEGTRVSII